MFEIAHLKQEAIDLLQQLIAIPSFSKEEEKTADLLASFFEKKGIPVHRKGNNIWVYSKKWSEGQDIYLLNSHHDTVQANADWTRNPFQATIENGKLFGLGSNDAGASLVALIACFLFFYNKEDLPFNLVLAATAEEEISGKNGIASILNYLPQIKAGIVGEPTSMKMAVAEKGLMVVDALAVGTSGHAARQEGENALYKAIADVQWIQDYAFEKVSKFLGPTKMTVTQIEAGSQHNVVPDQCHFVIDIRTNEHYTNEAIFQFLEKKMKSKLKARSFRLRSSSISLNHPLVKAGEGLSCYGSPTLSDQALMPFPCLKLGCGDSKRSHTADEFVYLQQIENGIDTYIQLLNNLV